MHAFNFLACHRRWFHHIVVDSRAKSPRGVQTLRPIEGRGDGGGGAAACDWLVGGGYGTPIDARVAQCKNCHNLCDVLL